MTPATDSPTYQELVEALRGLLDNSSPHERPGASDYRDHARAVLRRAEGKAP